MFFSCVKVGFVRSMFIDVLVALYSRDHLSLVVNLLVKTVSNHRSIRKRIVEKKRAHSLSSCPDTHKAPALLSQIGIFALDRAQALSKILDRERGERTQVEKTEKMSTDKTQDVSSVACVACFSSALRRLPAPISSAVFFFNVYFL